MRQEKLYAGVSAMPTVTTDAMLTRNQVAELFSVSTQTIDRLTKAGKLPAVRLGAGSIRYKRSNVQAYIESCLTK